MKDAPMSLARDNILLQTLEEYFDEEELRTLAFNLDIDYESLPARGKAGKARELALFFQKRNRLSELIDAIQKERPDIERIELAEGIAATTLPEALALYFSEEELKTLSFELGVDYENLPALGKGAKAHELVCALKRSKRLPELIELCQKKRPRLDNWDQLAVSCPRFSRQQIRTFVIAFAFLVALGLFWVWWPPPLSDGFNVVVAEFGEMDENGRVKRSEIGREISQGLYDAIETEIEQLPPTLRAELRAPGSIGIVKGANRDERAARAAEIAARHNATILIYGVISTNQQIELDFYVSDESFGYGSEVAGPDRLGKPIPLDTNLDPKKQFELNEKLNGRRQALQHLVKGLANYYVGRYEQAYADFKWITSIIEGVEEDGIEVIYLLMGAAKLQAYNLEGLPHQLESAQANFTDARNANGEYARSYLGLGAVVLANIDIITNTNAVIPELIKAEGLYLTALIVPDQPELAYIPIKAANGLGELYYRARQKGISSWAGQNAANELNCTIENDKDYVVEVGKCAFNQVLFQYEAMGQPSDLKWLIAHAHAKLGILAGYDGNWPAMIAESRQAIQMLEELPRDIVLANQIWIAYYWRNIGVAYEKQGQIDDARFAYDNAIRIGDGHVDEEEIDMWEREKP
ncbi:MAG: hypothetical protein GY803_10865 [Chloroflexi bacterium]|nr:hypothetical protein [Chloroflexota bacterium]